MSETRIALCSWCRTELPDSGDWLQDWVEVQHHFLIVHGERVNHSIRYIYPERVEDEFHRWLEATEAAS